MSEHAHQFARATVVLPFALDEALGWCRALQGRMAARKTDAFTRDEWAYLISFLDERGLRAMFADAFGAPAAGRVTGRIARPRGTVAVWLPNNVSLLGPLTLILLALTGNRVRAKAGARAEDLASEFLSFADSPLMERIQVERFDRSDARNAEMAAAADVRVAFGSDASMRAIDALPHPIDSTGFYFRDRTSEAWLDPAALDDATVRTLARVFAIYGRAGCTSPQRAVLIGGSADDARRLRDRLLRAWPEVVRQDVPTHIASQNVMAAQWAAALGWEAATTPRNAAALAAGGLELPSPDSPFLLTIVSAQLDAAVRALPRNIQTIGHNFADPSAIATLASAAGATRVVPLREMHHFGPVWDGHAWWRATFSEVEARP